MKNIIYTFISLFVFSISTAQVSSPQEFLGRPVGSKITPHWKVLEYYKYVADKMPNRVHYQYYGDSFEGRPMYVFFVSSEKNIARLEDIRLQNIQLTEQGENKLEQMPAIVWMSHNVHGNETSSMEASMMTLFELVNPNNAAKQQQLENTLVIIDPCLNPDGTERYNNWQNGILGVQYQPDMYAREHHEPWPGGRVNHYYFDLNRDWAWQTQKETRQRMQIYNSWLPHIHIDFHEMSINTPYYFPPAAEPFHEVITSWQREFQSTIGQHNARYFDKQGWLYFTKERFDLFYPSYGDTYPMYSGAIGMTYEKAGNSSAGLGVLTQNNDTLTLVDRAIQHHASAMNLVEVVSEHAEKVVNEFISFYQRANNGDLASYQSYLIKYDSAQNSAIKSLIDLLNRNAIKYYAAKGEFQGLDYESRKNVRYTAKDYDLLIPGNQPKAALVRVLFEPESKLSDSVTYDITAWSMPYVYGLSAIASSRKVNQAEKYSLPSVSNALQESFGYAIKWDGFSSAQLLGALLNQKIAVKRSEYAFKIHGQEFPRGSLLLLSSENRKKNLREILNQQADKYNVQVHTLESGIIPGDKDLGSSDVQTIKPLKVLMLAGESQRALSVGEVWHFFDQQLQYPIVLVNPEDLRRVDWSEIDVFIMANGRYEFLKDKTQLDDFYSWIRRGGKVIALENAVSELSALSWVNLKPLRKDSLEKVAQSPYKLYAERERESLKDFTAGAIYKMDFDATHPLMYGVKSYYTLRQKSSMYQYYQNNQGWNVGYIKQGAHRSGFVGSSLSKKLDDGLIFAVEHVGSGTIVFLTDDVLFRNFWDAGKLVMANALFQVN